MRLHAWGGFALLLATVSRIWPRCSVPAALAGETRSTTRELIWTAAGASIYPIREAVLR